MAMVDMVAELGRHDPTRRRIPCPGADAIPSVPPFSPRPGCSTDDVLGSEEQRPSFRKQADDAYATVFIQRTPWPGAIVHRKIGSGGLPYRVHVESGVPQPAQNGISGEPAKVCCIHDSEFIVVEVPA